MSISLIFHEHLTMSKGHISKEFRDARIIRTRKGVHSDPKGAVGFVADRSANRARQGTLMQTWSTSEEWRNRQSGLNWMSANAN